MYLTLFFAFLPIISCVLYCTSPLPDLNLSQNSAKGGVSKKNKGLLLCVACIFLGSAAENTMTNWISSYMENALGISKTIGDILGLALFGILLGLGRSLYSKYGKNIANVLLFGMVGATACYIIAGTVSNPIVCMLACIFTGVITPTNYVVGLRSWFEPFSLSFAMIKTVVFAFLITSISSYIGYNVKGGSVEVGKASTQSVVISSIAIIIFDLILTQMLLT
jgi:hypothetical protein